MQKKALIDVIVPVYKVEAYLEKCVESLLNQTFDDYVITLVDDGSPDGCPTICDRYQEAYPEKVRVIHKENGGLSDARNVGVQNSEAKFVIFVDSDDYVSERYIETLCRPHSELGADMVVAPVCKEYILENGETRRVDLSANTQFVMSRDEAMVALMYEKRFGAFAWGKLIPKELALRYPYPKGRFFEDSFTTYRQIYNCQKVVCISNAEYYYLQRDGSIQHRPFERKHMDLFYSVQEMMQFLTEREANADVCKAAAYRLCRSCYVTIRHASDLDFGAFKQVIQEIMPEYRRYFWKAWSGISSTKEKALMLLMHINPSLLRLAVRWFDR